MSYIIIKMVKNLVSLTELPVIILDSEGEILEFDTMERSLLYVAMTRAIQQLIITGTGKKSDWVRL